MDIKSYNNLLSCFHLPRIDEIPDLELYMDQVIIYVKKYFSIFPYNDQENFITPSMINNYVKSGIIPPPIGKKYTKRHIAYIISIFFLKQVLSLEESRALTMIEIKSTDEKLAYEYFCEAIETELKACVGETKSLVQNQKSEISSHILKKTATSIANKLYTQALIKYCITKK